MFIFSFIIIISNLFSLHFFNINTHSWYIWITITCIKNTITCKCMLRIFVLFCLCVFFKRILQSSSLLIIGANLVSCSSYIFFSVQTDGDGIDLDIFERLLQETPAPTETRYPFRRMLYVMTVHHNPMGSCLPPGEDRKVLSLIYHVYLVYMYIHTSRDLNEWLHVERDIRWSNHAKSSNIAINSLLCSSAYM